jgi:metal-responsive CopG/Arc/MetJ family transcriptional regulator
MARLKPIKNGDSDIVTSITLTKQLSREVTKEQKRIGARSKSEMIRLILEEYFKQELKEEETETEED